MKKKIVLLNTLLLAFVLSSCSLFTTSDSQMTILNDSDETISSIEVELYAAANSKMAIIYDALDTGVSVAPDEEVTFNLPNLANEATLHLTIYVDTDNYDKKEDTYIEYDDGANFTVKYKGYGDNPFDSFVIEDGQKAEEVDAD
ncbi:MAG: hypothetical protein ACPKM0_05435 [Pleomorphochaeta sp.]